MAGKRNEYGEGNYEATRQYNRATKRFVESGRVERAARDAAPRSPEEATEMRRAEQAALLRAKGGVARAGNDLAADRSDRAPEDVPRATRRSRAGDASAQADDKTDR